MFEGLIKIALKSALESQEIKEKIMKLKIKKQEQEIDSNNVIELDKDSYRVLK